MEKIKTVDLWATPGSMEELQRRVQLMHPDATNAMMFTWNYLASVINKELEDGDQDPEH